MNLPPLSKRLKNIVWHKFDVPWYWEQLKYEIKHKLFLNSKEKKC